jgi:spermidine synthase
VSALALLITVLLIAAVGLIYELVMGALASYLLGDSVTQFSTVIGVYLFALGLGAYLSRLVTERLNSTFVDVELATALIGGGSAPMLFLAFSFTVAFQPVLYLTVVAVGTLVGLELPLLIRILRTEYTFDELIARALSFDYAGSLVGSLAFSLLLVPRLGLVHTSLGSGLVNGLVAFTSTYWLVPADDGERRLLRRARWRAGVVILLLMAGLGVGHRLTSAAESSIYPGRILVTAQSPYQRIVLVEQGASLKLYLNGSLQFDGADEHRYHEALVHPAMHWADQRRSVLIAGGGDGLAAREVLKWSDLGSITLVDLDAKVTDLARDFAPLRLQNRGALVDPRVVVVNADAMTWLATTRASFDVVILDFPDPSNYSVGKLYSTRFYLSARLHLAPGGALVVQSTSPFVAREAYWCIAHTLAASGFRVVPYHVFLPSFGEWGFVLGKAEPGARALVWPPTTWPPAPLSKAKLRYLDASVLAAMTEFGPDLSELETRVNRLDNQALVAYYLDAWQRYN